MPETKKTRYAVISYDHEEQQRLCDYVEADTEEEAEKIVLDARGESILGVAAILTSYDLRKVDYGLETSIGLPTTAAELRAALGMEPEEGQ